MTEEKEKALWKEAVFVFDTSALLDFYFYPIETSTDIFKQSFEVLKGKLWIPAHVEYEYLKNRKSQISKPISEKYNTLIDEHLRKLKTSNEAIIKSIEALHKGTFKPDTHPYLPQGGIKTFEKKTLDFSKVTDDFISEIKKEIDHKVSEILNLKENDVILEAFEAYFEVGDQTDFADIMEIVREGELRYKFQIPPGYLDLKEKEGTQIFGDLIIWKQILEYTKSISKNVIFITNDIKLDWCYKDKRNRVSSPREELIKEYYDNNGGLFWMYNQSQFLYKINEYYDADIKQNRIEQVSKVIAERNKSSLEFKCENCGLETSINFEDVWLYFELEEIITDREGLKVAMYQALQESKCNYCKCKIEFDYLIAIHPNGTEYSSAKNPNIKSGIFSDNAKILSAPNFVYNYFDGKYGFDEPDENLLREK